MLKFIKNYSFEIFLFVVVFVLCAHNFTPSTFLTGWDNLMPELNIWANLKRSIFSTWQEYQGLGLLAGMAHASDLIRQLIILPLTFILPANLIRYLWHFSMLFLGTYGVFKLVFYITKNKFAALISALFYLLNFGTVQYFYLPFDPYSTFWGFFPWLIYELFLYLDHPSSLKKLFWINLLAIPSFYVQTLFVVYIICILLILLINHKSLTNSIKIFFLIIIINSFWLLPNIYFTLTNVAITQNAFQNKIITDQFIEQNIYRGTLQSFGLLQNQYYDIKNGAIPLMQVWHQHFANLPIQIIGYLIMSIAILGIFSKNKYKKYILAILLFGLIGFLSDTFPFNFINIGFRQIPLLSQIFRNSFTKLLVPTVFSISVLLGLSLEKFKKINFLFIPLILILSWPSFFGNFISPKIRVDIPPEYFQLIQYLNSQDSSKRVIDLPQYNYWGWYTYSWGEVGSGFLWYGVDQPITSRTFDVWDNRLEDFYWQLHYAIIKQDPTLFASILNKYNVSYVLFDDNLSFPEAHNSGKVNLDNQKIIDNTPLLTLEKQFDNLKLYHYVSQPTIYTTSQNFSQPIFNSPSPINPLWSACTTMSNTSRISAINQENIVYYDCGSNLDLRNNYVIKVVANNISGRPLLYKVFTAQNNRLIIDSKLSPSALPQYIYIPSLDQFDQGIGINFSSLSLSQQPTINDLVSVEISKTNYNYFDTNYPTYLITKNLPINAIHPNQTFYRVTLNTADKFLVLPQSSASGWIALANGKILPHVLINNWANGWKLNDLNNQTVYIFFWPQLLEFLGFGLLIGTFIWLIRLKQR